MEHTDIFEIGGKSLTSRLFTGTGKYGNDRLITPYAQPQAPRSSPWRCAGWILTPRRTTS
jgi:hypothetical protein